MRYILVMRIPIVRLLLAFVLLTGAPYVAWELDLARGFWTFVFGSWALNSACNTILGTR